VVTMFMIATTLLCLIGLLAIWRKSRHYLVFFVLRPMHRI